MIKEKAIADGEQIDDKLDERPLSNTKDKWEEMKENKETLAIFNHKKASSHYCRASIAVAKS